MPIIITADSLQFPTVSKITPNKEINGYPMNDLGSVFVHYDPKLGRNVPTENKLRSDKDEESECEL